MSIDDQTYELIEKYLGDLMSPEAKAQFELKLTEDQELADLVEIFRIMPEYLEDNSIPANDFESGNPKAREYLNEFLNDDTKALKEQLDEKGRSFSVEEEMNYSRPFKVWRVAAVLIILFGAAFFLFRPSESDRLYAKYADHETITLNVRGDADQLAQDAEMLFNKGTYKKALPVLLELDEKQEYVNYDLQLAIGISQLETGDADAAILSFVEIYNSDALIRGRALYYLALANLKKGDKAAAKQVLNRVSNDFPELMPDKVRELSSRL
ncbi:MAG: tetratricopeptide repeat protein [Bacteroidetes bacterium]|nr:tetratricopeptide repeat protein [Bacteroidota bacterium]